MKHTLLSYSIPQSVLFNYLFIHLNKSPLLSRKVFTLSMIESNIQYVYMNMYVQT